jgi:hypothetical protein
MKTKRIEGPEEEPQLGSGPASLDPRHQLARDTRSVGYLRLAQTELLPSALQCETQLPGGSRFHDAPCPSVPDVYDR